jgi:glucose/arabinose dehydrogenase
MTARTVFGYTSRLPSSVAQQRIEGASMRMLGAIVGVLALTASASAQDVPKPRGIVGEGVPAFTVRPGYKVTLVAKDLDECRFLAFDDAGTLYVSQPKAGAIVALRDTDSNGDYDYVAPYVDGKPRVQAMQFKDGWLWFATSGGVFKGRDKDNDGAADDVETVIAEGQLPSGGGHWFRSLLVTDDGFYTSIGDASNASDQSDTDRQKIWHFDLKGGNKKLIATGVRNTEELQFRPGTTELWGSDHGSDNIGANLKETKDKAPVTDLNPPEEFNLYVEGGFYGHPFVAGRRHVRPEFASREDILELASKTVIPEWTLGAHWAVNGWTFLTRDAFPAHKGDAVMAAHGSWNSTAKVGYRVERILFDSWTGKPHGSHMLVGCLSPDGKEVLGRPCDVVEAPDGSLLFSCDMTKRVYRLSHEKIDENKGH